MIVINEEEIVEIASDFLSRQQGGENIELWPVRKRRKDLRHHAHLNLVSDLQFAFDPFFCCRGFLQVLDGFVKAARHLVKRGCESANLVLCRNLDLLSEVTARDSSGHFRQVGDWPRDSLCAKNGDNRSE